MSLKSGKCLYPNPNVHSDYNFTVFSSPMQCIKVSDFISVFRGTYVPSIIFTQKIP